VRRRTGAAAVLAGVAAIAPAGALATTDPVPAVPGAATALAAKPLAWTLAGVSRDGRSLLVRPGTYGGCDQGPPAIAVTETDRAVRVSVTVQTPTDPTVICTQIAHLPPTRAVALRAPVAGRAIGGPQRTTRPGAAFPDAAGPVGRERVPRVVGLRAADARSVLCAWSLRARPGAGSGTVIAQTPRSGRALGSPAPAPASSCSAIRPTVTLHTR
jgi:hypothetical protein